MSPDVWLNIEEARVLTGEVRETIGRKSKRSEYSCAFEKNGKYKNYLLNLDSLPEVAKNKYFGIKINAKHSKFYKESLPLDKEASEKNMSNLLSLPKV